MVSLYNKNGKLKPRLQYQAETWAHDLEGKYLMLHLEHPGSRQTKYERAALLKEFKEWKGMSYTEWKRRN